MGIETVGNLGGISDRLVSVSLTLRPRNLYYWQFLQKAWMVATCVVVMDRGRCRHQFLQKELRARGNTNKRSSEIFPLSPAM
jgi:hypothetical protein